MAAKAKASAPKAERPEQGRVLVASEWPGPNLAEWYGLSSLVGKTGHCTDPLGPVGWEVAISRFTFISIIHPLLSSASPYVSLFVVIFMTSQAVASAENICSRSSESLPQLETPLVSALKLCFFMQISPDSQKRSCLRFPLQGNLSCVSQP